MEVGGVRGLGSIDPTRAYASVTSTGTQTITTSFADQLRNALTEVNRLQTERDNTVRAAVAGRVTEPHDVMIAVEEAQMAFELLLEVRNRLLESYQEIMRLQV